MKSYNFHTIARRSALCATALATTLTFIPASLKAQGAAPSRINELVNLEFASEYVTPRGMMVHNQGITFEPLLLTLVNLYKGDGFVNDLTFDGGVWGDFSSAGVSVNGGAYGNHPKTDFTEIDPIAGISVGFAKHFTLSVGYTAFAEQILSIGTSQHLETKLAFDDSSFMGAYALHPYFSYWQELAGKATDADLPMTLFKAGVYPVAPRAGASHPAPNSSYYFDVGVDPSYTFKNTLGGLKSEAPCRIMLPDDRFYGDYYSSSSTVGIWEIGVKGTVPLNFMPAGYGHWSFHAGVNFMYFVDDNLVNLNTFNDTFGKSQRDTLQGFAGVSVFF